MNTGDDEEFRQEFVGKMARILRMALPARVLVPRNSTSDNNLLQAVMSAKTEIDHLRQMIDKYEVLAREMHRETETPPPLDKAANG